MSVWELEKSEGGNKHYVFFFKFYFLIFLFMVSYLSYLSEFVPLHLLSVILGLCSVPCFNALKYIGPE
jgi:hypothetical protein